MAFGQASDLVTDALRAAYGSVILASPRSRAVHFEIAHEFDIPLDALELAVISPNLVDKFGATVRELARHRVVRERTRT